VLACGIDRAYPAGHADLIAAIGRAGVIVSEQPPGRPVSRTRFLDRNRIVAALSAGTVVVEASRMSGSMHAARAAAGLGRPLMAVPGPVTSAASGGCHMLIRNADAVLVTCSASVIETLTGSMSEDYVTYPGGVSGSPRKALGSLRSGSQAQSESPQRPGHSSVHKYRHHRPATH